MKRDFLDNPKNVRRLVQGLVLSCILLFLMDAVIHRHTQHPWEEMFGFYGVYGFISCVILVLLAKELRKLIMRAEDYYRVREEQEDD